MNRKLLSVKALIIVAVALVATTSALISQQKVISNQGAIKTTVGVEVYTDAQTTTLCTSIDWGTIDEGGSVSRVIYVKSTAENIEILHLYANNWIPAKARTLMVVTWNKEGTEIQPGQVIAATITLSSSVDMQDVNGFNFNLVIEGTA